MLSYCGTDTVPFTGNIREVYMKYEKNRKIAGLDEYKLMKIAKIAIIPVIVLVLILVIVLLGKKDDKTKVPETATEAVASETGSNPTDAAMESVNNFDDYGLQQNAVEEVSSLVAKYQRAKTTGDAELMYEVFGKTPDEDIETLRASLAEESKAIESYDHTVCYTTAGCEDDSYIVFIASDLKFNGIDTAAPMLTWAYVYKAPDGKWYMKEPDMLNEEQQELLDKVSAGEDVKMLDNDMRTRLAQAVISDAKLATLYQMWSDTDGNEGAQAETDPDAIHVELDETIAADGNAESTSVEEAEIKIGN